MALLIVYPLIGAAEASAQEETPKPLRIDDAMATRTFGALNPTSISPDGKWVAYTIIDPRKLGAHTDEALEFLPTGAPRAAEGSELWITSTSTGESRNLTGSSGESWDGVWSPDGRHLAFYSDRDGKERIWVWDRTTGRSRRVSGLIAHPFFPFEAIQWTPDGTQLLVKLLPEGERVETTPDAIARAPHSFAQDSLSTAVVYSTNTGTSDTARAAVVYAQRNVADLALVSVTAGTAVRLVRRQPIVGYAISPTGGSVAYTSLVGVEATPERTNRYDIGVVDVATGTARVLAQRVSDFWGPPLSWSPDGAHLAFTSKLHDFGLYDRPERLLPAGDCFVVDLATDSVRNVTPGAHVDFGSDFAPPVWDRTGAVLYVVGADALWRIDTRHSVVRAMPVIHDRRLIAVLALGAGAPAWRPAGDDQLFVRTLDEATLRVGVARVDVSTGASTLLYEDDEALPTDARTFFGMAAAGSTLVYRRESAATPADLWVANPSFTHRHRLTRINPQLDRYTFGKSRLVHWLSDDGDSLRGAVLLPSDYQPGKRYPLIVSIYGGERLSMLVNNFGVTPITEDYMQLVATRGFAVLVPDAPQRVGTPMLDLAKDVLPGVNKVIELGIADPASLGIMGQSYGCISTLMILAQTTRFKAAQCSSGTSSLISSVGILGGFGRDWALGQGKMEGTPWQYRDQYIENSPYFYLDRITTPILMVNGTSDRAVPAFQQDATFEAFRTLGKTAVYVRYGGEGHVPMSYSAANRDDYIRRTLAWFDQYLGRASRLRTP